jgi:hypothetical protein
MGLFAPPGLLTGVPGRDSEPPILVGERDGEPGTVGSVVFVGRLRRALAWLLVWRTSLDTTALILFEGVGITVADELVLLLFDAELPVDRLLEMDEAGLLLGVVIDRRVGLADMVGLELAGHPSVGWVRGSWVACWLVEKLHVIVFGFAALPFRRCPTDENSTTMKLLQLTIASKCGDLVVEFEIVTNRIVSSSSSSPSPSTRARVGIPSPKL